MIEPLAHRAKDRNNEFMKAYGGVINRLVSEFLSDFATEDYKIDWSELVEFNSGSDI